MSIKPKPAPAVFGSDAAPVIYFDNVAVYGLNNGVVQLELTCNQLVPNDPNVGGVKTKHVVIAHLRGGIAAAAQLHDAIERAVALAEATDRAADKTPS